MVQSNQEQKRLNALQPAISGNQTQNTFLVTGSSGFLGRALVGRLLSRGHAVRTARPLKEARDASSGPSSIRMDASVQEWREAMEGCSGVFHLAWSTVPSTANMDPVADLETNLAGTVRMLEALRSRPRVTVVFVSSGGTVYGTADTLPILETHPLQPQTAYGASKVSVEHYMMLYRRTWGLDTRIVRLSNPFGPGQNIKGQLGAASIFAARALADEKIEIWGDGSTIRDYVYIDDAINGFLAAMLTPNQRFGTLDPIFNVGSGRGISLRELISVLRTVLEKPVEVDFKPSRGFDVPSNVLDISRARTLLGWTPTVTFEEGLARYITYLKEHAQPA
ncbi:NAD-dependent epimerase/dehydratase family protein [Caballeronia sp. BR00000012568055]|uniref:NAD-dependent epimerase/dehydratase family protein n=1 Tax=Caballeronia sp. BR00000012568055 TaxID=2918761 RepID=UPI0023F7D067|nr:NAD-dependent epimerase/dehydratase family protein [Caballeronia sp. BR00000012568055]